MGVAREYWLAVEVRTRENRDFDDPSQVDIECIYKSNINVKMTSYYGLHVSIYAYLYAQYVCLVYTGCHHRNFTCIRSV